MQVTPEKVFFDDNPLEEERLLLVARPWSSEISDYILANKIDSLYLNYARGWQGRSLDFLGELSQLKKLKVILSEVETLSPINELHNLEYLSIQAPCKPNLNFNNFPRLTTCRLIDLDPNESLYGCKSLRQLSIHSYSAKSFEPITRLTGLLSLRLNRNNKIEVLENVAQLQCLKSIELSHFTKLASIEGLEALLLLERIEFSSCKRIERIDAVKALARLREIRLLNMGKIESLRPLESCKNLEILDFSDETNIVDGNINLAITLPKLRKVFFMDRRHYSHSREAVGRNETLPEEMPHSKKVAAWIGDVSTSINRLRGAKKN